MVDFSGLDLQVTDDSHVSQKGSPYLSGGFSDSLSTPSLKMSWNLYDSGPVSGPGYGYVATSESTTSATYADLATTTDQITVNIGNSGMAVLFLNSFLYNSTIGDYAFVAFAMTGANTASASDVKSMYYPEASGGFGMKMGTPFLLTGLSAGSTTFKMKYRVNAGTGTFQERFISVIPL
jgi:hypothetical protein